MLGGRTFIPIDRFVVALRCDHFWGKIVRSATKCPGDIRHLLREAKIGNLDMTMSVQEQVFGFQVTVDDILIVQVFKGKGDFGGVEFGNWIWESLLHALDAR